MLKLKPEYQNRVITVKKTIGTSIQFKLWNATQRTLRHLYELGHTYLFIEENNSTEEELFDLIEQPITTETTTKPCNCKNKTSRKKK
jgi:hypothetical protein